MTAKLSRMVTIRLSVKAQEDLRDAALITGQKQGEIVADAIAEYLRNPKIAKLRAARLEWAKDKNHQKETP